MRITTRPLEADAEPWDPQDPGPFRALAGPMFLGTDEDGVTALIRTRGGCVMHVHPGWLAIRVDGTGEAIFASPENLGGGPACLWSAV